MRRLNRIASIPAGIFGLILTVPLTLAFIASMRELREMIEYLEKIDYFHRGVDFPWIEVVVGVCAVVAVAAIAVCMLCGKKSGWLAFSLWVYVFAQVGSLFQLLTGSEADGLQVLQLLIAVVTLVMMALECMSGLRMPVWLKHILLIGGMTAVELIGYLRGAEASLVILCENLFFVLLAVSVAGGDPRDEDDFSYEDA